MTIRVRLRPLELTTGVEYEYFFEGTHYKKEDDLTLKILQEGEDGKLHSIGCVHPQRWDAVQVMSDVEADTEDGDDGSS